MNDELIAEKIKELETALVQSDALDDEYDRLRQKLIPPEVQTALDDLAAEYGPMLANAEIAIAIMEDSLKALVIQSEKSHKGKRLHFVFTPAKPKWNAQMLDGMSAIIPEINAAREQGKPSVSLRGK